MVDNIRQLILKFKYIDKNFIYIIHTPLMLGLFTVHNKLFNLAKRALLKLWVNGNSISVDYVNIANKGGYIHLKIIFTRMSTATLVQKFKLLVQLLTHLTAMFHFYIPWKRRSEGITFPSNWWPLRPSKNLLFLQPLETSENQTSSEVFRWYRNVTLG